MTLPESAMQSADALPLGQLMRPPIVPRNTVWRPYGMANARETVARIRQFGIPNNTRYPPNCRARGRLRLATSLLFRVATLRDSYAVAPKRPVDEPALDAIRRSATSRPIAKEAVAAGDGAFSTCSMSGPV